MKDSRHEPSIILEGKKVVWVEEQNQKSLPYSDVYLGKTHMVTLWLVDEDQDDLTLDGDDWDDSPYMCNAEPPYENLCKGLVKIKVILGKPLEVVSEPLVKSVDRRTD